MPKYLVTLFYHGSASYEVEAEDECEAVEKARLEQGEEDKDAFFDSRLNLDEVDNDFEELPESPGGHP